MFERPWEAFFREKMELLLQKKRLLDIGGGLRIDRKRSNRLDKNRLWIVDAMKERGIEYVVLDYVDTYGPDIVGDIQHLSLPDSSEEAIACDAVLEHVEDPMAAARELYRVLAPDGCCFVYVPFLYYYHAHQGYYQDYWRFTEDSLRSIFKPFRTIEIANVRGAFETLVRLTPLGKHAFFANAAYLLDRMSGKIHSKQTSGYFVFLRK